ncbi:hypothetical protein J7K43_08665 [Candidatus Calescamantes bacterium]|nr:hypothetical protein [Candidatus Calescamantes bacterium]
MVKLKERAMVYENKNDAYFSAHFEELVNKHGGKWIVIAGGEEIAIGNKHELSQMLKKARKKYPNETPLAAPIPRKEELQCIL